MYNPIFLSSNSGLLHYNGEQWTLNKLPNEKIIRSVAVVDDKIYTGFYEEFEFWKKNDINLLEYFSLTHLIKYYLFTSEEFWQIVPYESTIIFRSFFGIYLYQNDKIDVLDSDIIVTFYYFN